MAEAEHGPAQHGGGSADVPVLSRSSAGANGIAVDLAATDAHDGAREESAKAASLVGRARLTMDEIVSFVDSYNTLCTMSAVCTSWRDGVRCAPVTLSAWCTRRAGRVVVLGASSGAPLGLYKAEAKAPRQVTVAGPVLSCFRRSLPHAAAVNVARGAVDDDLDALLGMQSLLRLTLGWQDGVTDAGMAGLLRGASALTRLTTLDIGGCYQLSEATAERLDGLPLLSDLRLYSGCLAHHGCAALARMGGLRSLHIKACGGGCSRRVADGAGCATPEGGHGACVCEVGPSWESLMTLALGLTSLTELRLEQCYVVSGAALAAVARMPALESLSLVRVRGPREDPASLDALRAATALTRLDLTDCLTWVGVADDDMAALRGMTCLRELGLTRCALLGDEGMASLAGYLPQLRTLDLVGTRVTGTTLHALLDRTALTALALRPLQTSTELESAIAARLTESSSKRKLVMTVY